jgi:hypothetical protein
VCAVRSVDVELVQHSNNETSHVLLRFSIREVERTKPGQTVSGLGLRPVVQLAENSCLGRVVAGSTDFDCDVARARRGGAHGALIQRHPHSGVATMGEAVNYTISTVVEFIANRDWVEATWSVLSGVFDNEIAFGSIVAVIGSGTYLSSRIRT